MATLIDTSFLVAVASPRDANHIAARATLHAMREPRIVTAPVLPELFYMLAARVNYATALNMFDSLRTSNFHIEALSADDMARMGEIMAQYRDNAFDFVDAAIMAVAERLSVTEIHTFDRRDFTTFRPSHCDFFELLP